MCNHCRDTNGQAYLAANPEILGSSLYLARELLLSYYANYDGKGYPSLPPLAFYWDPNYIGTHNY